MRILFVLPYVPSLIRVRSFNLIRELAQRHEVTVLATHSGAALAEAGQLRDWGVSLDVVPLRLPGALISCAGAALRGDPLQAAVCWSPALERRLRHLLITSAFDVVHVEHLRVARAIAALADGPATSLDAVDCISLLLERTLSLSHSLRQRMVAALELRRTRAFEARVFPRYDRVAATSEEDAAALAAVAPGLDVAVLPNCVDTEYFQPLVGGGEPTTLVLSGKMSYHANVTAALHFIGEVFPLIRRKHPEVRLRIVGSDPTVAIRRLARDPGIEVTGHVPDIRALVGCATVAICPVTVKVGTQYKVLEAMALGVPVVSTPQGAGGLWAEPGRDLLVAENPTGFADAISQLLADPSLREQVGQAGRRYVEARHQWPAAGRQLEGLYGEAIARRAAAGGRGSRCPVLGLPGVPG